MVGPISFETLENKLANKECYRTFELFLYVYIVYICPTTKNLFWNKRISANCEVLACRKVSWKKKKQQKFIVNVGIHQNSRDAWGGGGVHKTHMTSISGSTHKKKSFMQKNLNKGSTSKLFQTLFNILMR